MADDAPPTAQASALASLLPVDGMTHHAEREKFELGRRMAQAFLDAGNGQGFEACLAVLLTLATSDKVRSRVKLHAAAAYATLSVKASVLLGPKVAVQVNNGIAPGVPSDPRRTPEFWQGAMADPTARAELLAGLSAAVGAPPPVNATACAKPAAAPPVNAGAPAVNAGAKTRRTSKPAAPKAGAA